jgi:threonine dehydrogenase-like Zn-dependent dehydrogenase
MRAFTFQPGQPDTISLDEVLAPPGSDGTVLVRALALGICGTDREIIAGHYGWAPPGQQRLVIGHESLGRVEDAPADCGVKRGDLVVALCDGPIRCRARPAPPANGTCAATASIPNAASSSATAMAVNNSASSRIF